MLVLSRKSNQSIIVGDDVEIMIVEIKGDQVKLGIKAPRSVRVYRGEIYDEIQKENIAAAKTSVSKIDKNLENLIKKRKK